MERSANWIWYFVILAVLTVVATTILIVYNLRQQLRPEQLAAARALWEAKGPRDYELRYTTKKGTEEEPDRYVVRVRGGQTVSVLVNGRPLEARQYVYYGMMALFND